MRSLVVIVLVVIAGCAHDLQVRVPGTDPALAGRLELVFTDSASDVAVVVDGHLVVRDARTSRVVIDEVPAGIVELTVVAGSGPGKVERMQRVEVDIGRTTTVPLAAPERSVFRDVPATILMLVLGASIKLAMLGLI